jgi:riboflavin synthase
MFTGIIEQLAKIVSLRNEGGNLYISCKSAITHELKIDQSVAHNGVCLTVVEIKDEVYTITAIKETLDKTNLSELQIDDVINIERCMKLGDRFDGHMVQGHVDQTATCTQIKEEKGSHVFTFKHKESDNMTVEKGSVCVNGVSLTVINSQDNSFSVAIIPYTFEHTNFHTFKVGSVVNIEFDIIGKYIAKIFIKNL